MHHGIQTHRPMVFSIAEKPPSMRSLPLRGPELLKKFPNVLIPGSVEKKRGGRDTIKRVLAYDKHERVTDTGENTSTQ